MKKLSLILFGLAFAFAGCKNASSLAEGEWKTRSLEIDGAAQEICESSLAIEKGENNIYKISGDSGVNRFFGSAKIEGTSFSVQDDMGSTKMAGEPGAMQFEDNFLKALIESVSFSLYKENGSDFLSLENKDGSIKLVFMKK